jgi:L-ribulose-5-phosphate 3-epimerase
VNRRGFLAAAAGAAFSTSQMRAARLPIRKGVLISMLPKDLSLQDGMQAAIDAGFQDIECQTVSDPKRVEEIKTASEKTGLRIHSVMNMAHWTYPLNSPDPAVVKKSMDGLETSLRNAHFWGAETVLLVPAVVGPKYSYYEDAWTRSQKQIRTILPLAEELKVIIAIEEVWNKFLLSPPEHARYVDEFKSPWLKAYFDVGNVVFYGYPQDWIRTLGNRIAKVHLKDFRYHDNKTAWVPLREGDIDWKEVHAAFADIGYHGTATVELEGGNAAYLKDVSRRVDSILEGT